MNPSKVKSNRKKPCRECPFSRTNILDDGDAPGGSDVRVYIGQIQGPCWLPCHMDKKYEGKASNYEEVEQCAGAAIFRANVKKSLNIELPDALLFLKEDTKLVFDSFEEFFAHYKNVSLSQAREILDKETLYNLLTSELSKCY